MSSKSITIGALARGASTKVETIRFYEKSGLLPVPARTSANYRAYDADHLRRLTFIRRSRDLGFSLDQVRALLALADQRDCACEAVDAIAHQHLAEVQRKIAGLVALRCELERMIGHCQSGTVADCRIIDALSPKSEV